MVMSDTAHTDDISIHALREEGDVRLGIMPKAQLISIHALREEGDAPLSMGPAKPMYFYPRPPRGGRPHDVSFVGQCDFISIHALREEGDEAR